ncbi:MAG: type 1 glutamine amidotransferase [Candidatus Nanopelagicales bacterium]
MATAIVLSHSDIANELGHLEPWLAMNDFKVTRSHRELVGPLPQGDLLIVMGSPTSVAAGHLQPSASAEIAIVADWVGQGRPYLGICFGAQVLARALGGTVQRMPETFRAYNVVDTTASQAEVFAGPWVIWHDDVITAPPGCQIIGTYQHGDLIFRKGSAWGLQPHIEVTAEILERMAIALGAPEHDWQPLTAALAADAQANSSRTALLLDTFLADT